MVYKVICSHCGQRWSLEMPKGWKPPVRSICPDCHKKWRDQVKLEQKMGRHQIGKE